MARLGAHMTERRSGSLRSLPRESLTERPAALDPLIHERLRLAIVSALAASDSMTFPDLKRLLQTSDGNLSIHARKLEDAGYLSCSKAFAGRYPQTTFRLTAAGRQALERYLDHMEAIIRAVRGR